MPDGKRILLIVGGGIAAYKSLELIRRLAEGGISTRVVLTRAGSEFVTPLSLSTLSGEPVHEDLFSLTDEAEMGHIQLSREADLLVVAPATADLMAKMAAGLADDLASTVLLATDTDILVAPAMNVRMWEHPATRRNVDTLRSDGVSFVGPDEGDMACGEFGEGRMAEPEEIARAIEAKIGDNVRDLEGLKAVVTSGPTQEPIDPVRFIGNRSSGKQGHAIAAALAARGAETVLVSGPVSEPDPSGVSVCRVTTACEMLAACESALPADIVVCAAAVADWRAAETSREKLKKDGRKTAEISFVENPDICATLGNMKKGRPRLVIGFAAETSDVVEHAKKKRVGKGCDWILANDVSVGDDGKGKVFGAEGNLIHFVTETGAETWPEMQKTEVAGELARRIARHLVG